MHTQAGIEADTAAQAIIASLAAPFVAILHSTRRPIVTRGDDALLMNEDAPYSTLHAITSLGGEGG